VACSSRRSLLFVSVGGGLTRLALHTGEDSYGFVVASANLADVTLKARGRVLAAMI
jgi:hypothetical protein